MAIWARMQITLRNTQHNVVTIGATVVIKVNGKERKYTIVGSNEANPSEGKISNESLVGKSLLSKRIGDKVTVTTPAGESVYEIVAIE